MKKNENTFLTFVKDALGTRYSLTARAMFGGYGLYHNNSIMGIIIEDVLYLKANAETAPWFRMRHSEPFTYERKGKKIAMSYWKVPEEVLENKIEFEEWVECALKATKHTTARARNKE